MAPACSPSRGTRCSDLLRRIFRVLMDAQGRASIAVMTHMRVAISRWHDLVARRGLHLHRTALFAAAPLANDFPQPIMIPACDDNGSSGATGSIGSTGKLDGWDNLLIWLCIEASAQFLSWLRAGTTIIANDVDCRRLHHSLAGPHPLGGWGLPLRMWTPAQSVRPLAWR